MTNIVIYLSPQKEFNEDLIGRQKNVDIVCVRDSSP